MSRLVCRRSSLRNLSMSLFRASAALSSELIVHPITISWSDKFLCNSGEALRVWKRTRGDRVKKTSREVARNVQWSFVLESGTNRGWMPIGGAHSLINSYDEVRDWWISSASSFMNGYSNPKLNKIIFLHLSIVLVINIDIIILPNFTKWACFQSVNNKWRLWIKYKVETCIKFKKSCLLILQYCN